MFLRSILFSFVFFVAPIFAMNPNDDINDLNGKFGQVEQLNREGRHEEADRMKIEVIQGIDDTVNRTDERITIISDQTHLLQQKTPQFRKDAEALKRKLWWKRLFCCCCC